jgi:hypothetical protein
MENRQQGYKGCLENCQAMYPTDTEEHINRLILIHQKYRKTGREYN